ncbi:ENDD1 protein, partial [Atractosteus spatula]|nr:ENDD1 protein [Atractosteus spatula]
MQSISVLCLALAALCTVNGEVFNDFNQCNIFFFRNTPVIGLDEVALPVPQDVHPERFQTCLSAYGQQSPAFVCQRTGNQYHFASLYDRGRRIPLYSAYEMDLRNGTGGRQGYFNVEPQVEIDTKRQIANYNKQQSCNERIEQYRQMYKLKWSQAVDEDFQNWDRGHLNPAGHHSENVESFATFTLTNVAPMSKTLNTQHWNKYEQRLRDNLTAGCSHMYVVTGVVPGQNTMVNRVNIPSHFWNAYCCTDNNDVPLRAGGAIAENTDYGYVDEKGLSDLQLQLRGLLHAQNFDIFQNCAPHHISSTR